MENTTIEEVVKKVKAQNRCLFKQIEKEAKANAKMKQKERIERMKKSDKIFKRKEKNKAKRKIFQENKSIMIMLRKKGYSIRAIVELFIRDIPSNSDLDYVSKTIFNKIKVMRK